jgi:polymorphic toxin system DSP-PTPase phosphatase-like protein
MDEDPYPLLWWAIPGVLAGMPMPYVDPYRRLNQGGASDYDDELAVLYKAGIRAVVPLISIPSDETVYTSAGFSFLCLPIPNSFPPSMEQTLQFVSFVNQMRSENRPVAVHCEAGIGRTGTIIAAYLICQGDSVKTAVARVRAAQPRAIETERQYQFLLELERQT